MIWGLVLEKVVDFGADLILGDDDLDMDDDGDVDVDDVEALINRLEMFSSVMGHVAQVDDDVSEDEEDEAWSLINEIAFNSKILTPDKLELANLTKKKVQKRIMKKFENPESLKKISKYAVDNEMEEKFYEIACIMVMADGSIDDEEREFLDVFAEILDLMKYDKRSIERKFIKK